MDMIESAMKVEHHNQHNHHDGSMSISVIASRQAQSMHIYKRVDYFFLGDGGVEY